MLILFWSFYFSTSLERSILKLFFVCCFEDFFDIVELLRRCYFDFRYNFSLMSMVGLSALLLVTCWRALVMLIFLNLEKKYLECWTVVWVLCGWYIFRVSTFGLLFLCWELSIEDFAGIFSWMDLLILLIRLLTAVMVGLLLYYLPDVLGFEFFWRELFFMGNKYISIFVY